MPKQTKASVSAVAERAGFKMYEGGRTGGYYLSTKGRPSTWHRNLQEVVDWLRFNYPAAVPVDL